MIWKSFSISGERITHKDSIKKVSLEHCARILSKNKIRECDKEDLREKKRTHKSIMENGIKKGYELSKEMYHEVLASLKKKTRECSEY